MGKIPVPPSIVFSNPNQNRVVPVVEIEIASKEYSVPLDVNGPESNRKVESLNDDCVEIRVRVPSDTDAVDGDKSPWQVDTTLFSYCSTHL